MKLISNVIRSEPRNRLLGCWLIANLNFEVCEPSAHLILTMSCPDCRYQARCEHLDALPSQVLVDELIRRSPAHLKHMVLTLISSASTQCKANVVPHIFHATLLSSYRFARAKCLRYLQAHARRRVRQDAPFLLQLPPELRLRIYDFVFQGAEVCPHAPIYFRLPSTPEQEAAAQAKAMLHKQMWPTYLLQTCRQIRYEALLVFRNSAMFTFPASRWFNYCYSSRISVSDPLKQLRRTWRPLGIKAVRVTNMHPADWEWYYVSPWLYQTFPGMRKLEVVMEHDPGTDWCVGLRGEPHERPDTAIHHELTERLQQWRNWHIEASWLVSKTSVDITITQLLSCAYMSCKHDELV